MKAALRLRERGGRQRLPEVELGLGAGIAEALIESVGAGANDIGADDDARGAGGTGPRLDGGDQAPAEAKAAVGFVDHEREQLSLIHI